jgi:hypothetical protein
MDSTGPEVSDNHGMVFLLEGFFIACHGLVWICREHPTGSWLIERRRSLSSGVIHCSLQRPSYFLRSVILFADK